MRAYRCGSCVAGRSQLVATLARHTVVSPQQGREHELLQDRRAEVEGRPSIQHRRGQRLRDTNPPNAQPAPKGLCGAAKNDGLRGEGAERLHCRSAVKVDFGDGFVDNRSHASPRQGGGQTLSPGVVEEGTGRIVEIRDEVCRARPTVAQHPLRLGR